MNLIDEHTPSQDKPHLRPKNDSSAPRLTYLEFTFKGFQGLGKKYKHTTLLDAKKISRQATPNNAEGGRTVCDSVVDDEGDNGGTMM